MNKFILITLLFAGGVSFAQPTSGDIIMDDEVDSLKLVQVVEQTEEALEANIISAFTSGDASLIAVYFGDNVDLAILGKENLYSKSQAQQVLQHFFTDNQPHKFDIVHKGNAKTNQYFIGEFTNKKAKTFRVTLNSKTINNKCIVTSLTVEED